MLCGEDGEVPARGSQIRGQSLSHKEGQDYDSFEWQVGGIAWSHCVLLRAQRHGRAACCKSTAASKMQHSPLFAMDIVCLWGGKIVFLSV